MGKKCFIAGMVLIPHTSCLCVLPVQLSGLEDALEYCELDKQFATQKTKNG